MTDEIAQALLDTLASLVPSDTQLVAGDPCPVCGHCVVVTTRGVGLCIVCNSPGEWSATTRMEILRVLGEAQEHSRHLARLRPTMNRAQRVQAIRNIVGADCSVWVVPALYVCGECGASIKIKVGTQVLCSGCQLPASWSAGLRDRVQSLAIGAGVRA